ncbi:MAG: hypothetical protein E7Z85_07435 [Methanosphaera stadtmanae]|nr:hypothetical protein [Methanosphaera stadtmanae]
MNDFIKELLQKFNVELEIPEDIQNQPIIEEPLDNFTEYHTETEEGNDTYVFSGIIDEDYPDNVNVCEYILNIKDKTILLSRVVKNT